MWGFWDALCGSSYGRLLCVVLVFAEIVFAVEAPRNAIMGGRHTTIIGLYVLPLLNGVDEQLPVIQMGAMQLATYG